MRLYIPEIGDILQLTSDWTFNLYYERRNDALIEYFNLGEGFRVIRDVAWKEYQVVCNLRLVNKASREDVRLAYTAYEDKLFVPVTLNSGAELKIDRIYIRKGNSEYSSVSFWYNPTPGIKKSRSYRFWAKLSDVNNIEFGGNNV